MSRKALFFDIDGTLIDHRGEFAPSAERALRRAQRRGHIVALATGRNYVQVYPVLKDFGFDAMVTAAGAYVLCGGQEVYHATIPEDRLAIVFEYFDRNQLPVGLQGKNGTYVTQYGYEQMQQRFSSIGVAPVLIDTIMNSVTVISDIRQAKDVEKMFYNRIGPTVSEVQAAIGDYFLVAPSSFGDREDEHSGEIMIRGIDKPVGIAKVLEYYGIDKKDAYAFGDAANDISMMRAVGCGVAMGNAWPQVKEAADYVTDDIHADGIANAMQALGLLD